MFGWTYALIAVIWLGLMFGAFDFITIEHNFTSKATTAICSNLLKSCYLYLRHLRVLSLHILIFILNCFHINYLTMFNN